MEVLRITYLFPRMRQHRMSDPKPRSQRLTWHMRQGVAPGEARSPFVHAEGSNRARHEDGRNKRFHHAMIPQQTWAWNYQCVS